MRENVNTHKNLIMLTDFMSNGSFIGIQSILKIRKIYKRTHLSVKKVFLENHTIWKIGWSVSSHGKDFFSLMSNGAKIQVVSCAIWLVHQLVRAGWLYSYLKCSRHCLTSPVLDVCRILVCNRYVITNFNQQSYFDEVFQLTFNQKNETMDTRYS